MIYDRDGLPRSGHSDAQLREIAALWGRWLADHPEDAATPMGNDIRRILRP